MAQSFGNGFRLGFVLRQSVFACFVAHFPCGHNSNPLSGVSNWRGDESTVSA
jgi:hypothetical protein